MRVVLRDLLALPESALVEPFHHDHKAVIAKARHRLVGEPPLA